MDEPLHNTASSLEDTGQNTLLLPPLLGCLVCHADSEGVVQLTEARQLPIPQLNSLLPHFQYPTVTCSNCGASAFLDEQSHWRIRYRHIPKTEAFAASQFKGWVVGEKALDISTDVYIQRQRLAQIEHGDLGWLKPERLTPPPPLMNPDELVYLTLRPASYCESASVRLPLLRKLGLAPEDIVRDTGTLYVTDSKLHLLGQRRDRSQRLSDVWLTAVEGESWLLHVGSDEAPRHYQGYGDDHAGVDARLVVAVIESLVARNEAQAK